MYAPRPDSDPINQNPFLQLIGARMEEAAGRHSRLTLEVTPQLQNLHGFSHGGVS
jgi:acyl-coenzyme A thioesterase PaaI-like protein